MASAQQPLLAPYDGHDDPEAAHTLGDNGASGTIEQEEELSAVQWFKRHRKRCLLILLALVVIAAIITVVVVTQSGGSDGTGGQPLASYQDALAEGEALCVNDRSNTTSVSPSNAQRGLITPIYIIRNASVWTGLVDAAGEMQPNTDVLIYNGTIIQIAPTPINFNGATIIDATGKHVTPGLVDLHSHIGVYAQPELHANLDGNEATNPVFPQVRAIDAYSPRDESIGILLNGGVTTSLVLPGSANTMGGEAFAVKLNGSTVALAQIHDAPRYMKMACGENPKNNYGSRGMTPDSRMGSAWVMRERFELAKKLAVSQDDWCAAPSTTTRYPTDLSLDSLVALLRGSLLLNVHCYTVWDMEMMIRLSKEFNFKIAAFHHAIEAWKLAETLAEEDIVTATFADSWGFKDEGYYASVRTPQILYNAGAKVVIKTDHPVVAGDTLMYEAAKTVAYGFSEVYALASVTSVPAETMKLDNRLGSLEVGKDADIVIWDRSPFLLGAQADQVFLNGERLVNKLLPAVTTTPTATPAMQVSPSGICPTNMPSTSITSYSVTNALIYDGQGGQFEGLNVVDGVITCLGTVGAPCEPLSVVFNMNQGTVIAGMANFGNNLGLAEIEQEPITQDGVAQDSWTLLSGVVALDGVQFFSQSHLVEAAFAAGITWTITPPMGTQLVIGQSSAFLTGTGPVVTGDLVLKSETALHVALGQYAKGSGLSGSISGQIAALKALLSSTTPSPTFSLVLNGTLPLVIHVNNADVIVSALRMLGNFPSVRIVLYGAAEAHLVVSQIQAAGASVILKGIHCFPKLWEEQRCNSSTIMSLVNANIPTAIAPQSIDWTRNLRWEAGLAMSYGLTFDQALAAVTTNLAEMFGLTSAATIQVGQPANFAAFNGSPFSLQTTPQLVGVGGTILCYPAQL